MRTFIAAVVLAFLLVLATAASGATPPAPNVKGTVVRTTQSCPPGEPCDPLPGPVYVFFTRNMHVTRVKLGASGGFAVHLAAGVYAVSTGPPRAVIPASLRVPRVGVIHPRFVQRGP